MLGDQTDMLRRLRSVLPVRWFPDQAPVLDGLLGGLAAGWALIYGVLDYVRAQTRIATASGVWLDIIALDFFGRQVARRPGQGDDALRNAVRRELFRERGTREAVVSVLRDLTGRAPVVFEPGRAADTGGYGARALGTGTGLGYGAVGGWGSLVLPFQCFVTAYRPVGTGIADVNGWGGPAGGYGSGILEYASLAMVQGQVTDSDIYSAVAMTLPVASTGWVRISS